MLPDPSSLVLIALLSSAAHVPDRPVVTFGFAAAAAPPASALTRDVGVRPLRHRAAKKATAAVAGGVLGFFAGMLAGAGVGALVQPDAGALPGMMIGAPIGAVGGGVLAALWAR